MDVHTHVRIVRIRARPVADRPSARTVVIRRVAIAETEPCHTLSAPNGPADVVGEEGQNLVVVFGPESVQVTFDGLFVRVVTGVPADVCLVRGPTHS